MNYKKLKELVDKENLSQNKAATAFGMSAPGYKEMIDNHTMKVETLDKVSRHFNVPVSYFFDETEAEQAHEPQADYKTNGCQLCREKYRTIHTCHLLAKKNKRPGTASDVAWAQQYWRNNDLRAC